MQTAPIKKPRAGSISYALWENEPGYVFADPSASLLSKVAFANSYATLALSQRLRADVQTISGAMNLTAELKDAIKTLPIGSAVVRLADERSEPSLVRIPRCPIREGSVSDREIRQRMATHLGDSTQQNVPEPRQQFRPVRPQVETLKSQ